MQASSSRDNPRRKVNAAEVFTGVAVRRRAPIKEERAATAAKVCSRGTDDYLWIYYLGTPREKQEKSPAQKVIREVRQRLNIDAPPAFGTLRRQTSSEIPVELYTSH
jgi:hypothetical protein